MYYLIIFILKIHSYMKLPLVFFGTISVLSIFFTFSFDSFNSDTCPFSIVAKITFLPTVNGKDFVNRKDMTSTLHHAIDKFYSDKMTKTF